MIMGDSPDERFDKTKAILAEILREQRPQQWMLALIIIIKVVPVLQGWLSSYPLGG